MMGGNLGLFVDIFVSILLVAVIVYAVRLNKSLSSLKSNKAELESLVASFNDSTNRAEASVARLKASAVETAKSLQENVARAQELRDDLSYMTDRANEMADRLEGAIGDARPGRTNSDGGKAPRAAANPLGTEKTDDKSADDREKSKSDLLKALQGMR